VYLASAGIVVDSDDPPPHIQSQLSLIFQAPLSPKRKEAITHIAEETCNRLRQLSENSREDDWTTPVIRAFQTMDLAMIFNLKMKNGMF